MTAVSGPPAVSEADDLRPGDLGVGLSEGGGQAGGGLADDLQEPDQREVQQAVIVEVGAPLAYG